LLSHKGASGYLGAHVLSLLLQRGYKVRVTARSQVKADDIAAKNAQRKDKLEFAIVPDIIDPHAYDKAVVGVTHIIHVASPLPGNNVKSYEDDLIKPAVEGTVNILRAAKNIPSVKRVVITSSIASIVGGHQPPYVYSEKDWNPITYEQAIHAPIAFVAYSASKKLAEKAAWDFLEQEKPHFDIVTILPPFLYGPFAHPIESKDQISGTPEMFFGLIEHRHGEQLHTTLQTYVDVRDAAQAHIAALEKHEAGNNRFYVGAGNYFWQELADITNKFFPGKTQTPVGTPGEYPTPSVLVDNTKSKTVLGIQYRSLEELTKDAWEQLLQFRATNTAK